jgi:hypothetical protein
MKTLSLYISAILLLLAYMTPAQEMVEQESNQVDLFDLSLEELLELKMYEDGFQLFGYINSNFENVFHEPFIGTDGLSTKYSNTKEWFPVKAFHIYGKGNLSKNISVLFNLAGANEMITVRNAWGNFEIRPEFQIRMGKMYRKFGLYNEKLDQIPTFIGIEPPELFDTDHLFLTRTTDFMIHGQLGDKMSYALTTGNGEGTSLKNVFPLGWDLRYKNENLKLTFGTSGYVSSVTNVKSTPSVKLGDGAANGGILPWMEKDHFNVMGLFVEKTFNKFLIQSEYWISNHNAIRNADDVLTLINDANINAKQRKHFLGSSASIPNANLTAANVITRANYTASTFYIRLGYEIQTSKGQFIPYVFYDRMTNPEIIQNKKYGGDNEVGLSDNGTFSKPSVGVVYKPIPQVAVKLDGSMHSQKFNGKTVNYSEVRVDVSFAFDALKNLR